METLKKYNSKGAVKDVDAKGRTVTGYYATWGAPADEENPQQLFIDSDGDVFDSKAFNTTVQQNGPQGSNRIWHLINHNFGMPINKPKVLRPDNIGVYFETEFLDTTLGNDYIKLYEAGAITEHSVMFNIIQARKEALQGMEYQLIQEVRMWEGSSVLWGANSNTPTIGLKSEQAEVQIKLLDSLMHNGTFSDETFVLIESLLNDLKAIKSGTCEPTPEPIEPQPTETNGLISIHEFYKQLNTLKQ